MIADLHSHYPMHLLAGEPSTLDVMLGLKDKALRDKFRAFLLRIANFFNYPDSPGPDDKPAVTIQTLKDSNVRIVLSVLYSPFDEMDLSLKYGSPPKPSYFEDLVAQVEMVEQSLVGHEADAVIAHNPAELKAALAANKIALLHALEGGFHLGDSEAAVEAAVGRLAKLGIAYITVSHLFWRQVATNSPALPFLPDWLYRLLFPQPAKGLTKLGRAAVRAMVKNRVLIDLTHMSQESFAETLELLAEIDPQKTVPVMATHSACRLGKLSYSLTDEQIAAIASRKGVVGLIACTHYMADGVMKKPKTFEDTMTILYRHIDHIKDVTGLHEFTAFGSDQDGFIKPTLPGLDWPAGYQEVEKELEKRYGPEAARRICSGNARRVLEYWASGS